MKRLLFLSLLCSTLSAWAVPPKVQFFPVSGITLGVSNYADARRVGAVPSSSFPPCYKIDDMSLWDDDNNGIFEKIYITKTAKMPSEWRAIGMSWELSYVEWSLLFKELGFTINVTKKPSEISGLPFSAEFEAVSLNGLLRFELRFDQGHSHSAFGQGTLYAIKVFAEGSSVTDYVFINSGEYESPVPADGSAPSSETSSWVNAGPDSFRAYAKDYVEQKINEWQKKGRYEKTVDWQVRVTEATREAKIRELTTEAEKLFIAEQSKQVVPDVSIVDYDADNEVFMIRDRHFGDLLVPVPIAQAEQFEKGFASMQKSPKYFINDDRLALSELALTDASGHRYTYSNQASLNYAVTNIDYNFDPIEIDVAEQEAEPRGRQTISTVSVSAGKSDVDMNIPAAATRRERSFAVIIANEHYQSEADVEFAARDGEVFAEYCRRTLGLPDAQVRLVTDATLNNMRAQLNWLEQVTRAYEGDANVIFYYAGHGIPDEASKSAYLLPVDGNGSDVETGLKVADLYSRLGAMPARSVSVFLDACFSGARRDGEMLVAARGVAIKARDEVPTGNMVVFTAAQSDETAYPYREKQHGLFTYYLLKKLQESRGVVTFGELGDYISREVSRRSVVVNAKGQTPAVVVAPQLADSWRQISLGK